MTKLSMKKVQFNSRMMYTELICCTLLLVAQHFLFIGADSYVYRAVEDFTINCGTDTNSKNSKRIWVGDIHSQLFSLIESRNDVSSVPAAASEALPQSVKQVLYSKARVSQAEFTYSFQLTDGQKFIRLHFYPTSYLNFSRFNSVFSVKAGPYTLLKDFNASLTADNDNDDQDYTVSREYIVNVEPGQTLNITFTPTLSHPDAYAFINGIEVVSMPTDLYYTKPDGQGLKFITRGGDVPYNIQNQTALETVYRINVGGKQIPPEEDTGMFRNWEDDTTYLDPDHIGSTPYKLGPGPKYTVAVPNYTAPNQVYLTARTYGALDTSNHNLTWEFQVDNKFLYMIRLHFCEFEPDIQISGDRVFQIFLADNLAENFFDVISNSHGNLIPIYEDYAMVISSKERVKEFNLSIKLSQYPGKAYTKYSDVILNGIEIFKISDVDTGNLAGPNPDARLFPNVPPTKPPKSSSATTIVATVAGAGSGIIVLSLICFLIYRRTTLASVNNGSSKWRLISLVSFKSSKLQGSSLPSDLCRCFSLVEIREATNNFDDVLVIGVGGFGKVYKGYIDEGSTPVAVKRLKPGSQQGAHEFKTEIEMLSQLRHLHLVSLIGYCNDGMEMILVYDFMARGTLREHLYDMENPPLSWKKRLEICLGAAQGLNYLHTGAKHNIIHRDVKTTNILLNENWVAKVSDFGLSKFGPTGISISHISTIVKGSIGYLDPEYYKRHRLTLKSDVYSFGVVLLEVLCARQPVLRTVEKQQASLVEWVRKCRENGKIDQTVDPFLRGAITPQCLNKYVDMAFNCLLDDGNQRPSMNDVVWGLEFALQLQESIEGTVVGETEVEKKGEERALLKTILNDDVEIDVLFTSTDESSNRSRASKITATSSKDRSLVSGMVSSELLDPTA